MKRVYRNGLSLWQFDQLSREPAVQHFVSARNSRESSGGGEAFKQNMDKVKGGTKSGSFLEERSKEYTLSYSSSPDKEEIRRNRSALAAALGIEDKSLFFPSQVHKTGVAEVHSSTPVEELLETDALITNEKGICIAVLAADCVPILVYDKKNAAVGAIHSGWRGTAARILEKTLQEMQRVFGSRPEDILACIGPSVCQESYEVGEEVVKAFKEEYGAGSGLMEPLANGKAMLDLWKANQVQLLEWGLSASQIEVGGLCTVKNNEHFFSARKGDAGRFAAGIMLV